MQLNSQQLQSSRRTDSRRLWRRDSIPRSMMTRLRYQLLAWLSSSLFVTPALPLSFQGAAGGRGVVERRIERCLEKVKAVQGCRCRR
jgi:hypothetical protein